MAPPASSPKLLDTKKYSPPTPTWMLVAIAEALKPVINVMELAKHTTSMVKPRPKFPTTQPKRRYIISPRIVKILGRYTPKNVPNFLDSDIEDASFS